MTAEQVFLAALELNDPGKRAVYLAKACGSDTELRVEVEDLLTAHFKPGAFLDEPLGEQLGIQPRESNGESHAATDRDQVPVAEDEATDGPEDLRFLEPPRRPDSLGRLGHYEMLQILGKGGFGIVFRAFDEVLHRVVAVKVLAPTLAAYSPARKRFLREARSSAQIGQENVVQVFAVEEKPLPYLVMEFISGETLQQRLDRTGPLDVPEIVRLGRQIAEGLAAAHATGLIHRDVKPCNVLLEISSRERVKLTDFGLARTADDASLTQSGVLAGTPMYMAPEQARGESLDHRADLFSLGSVMYTMATGRPPFRAATTYAVLKRVIEEDPRPIRDVIPEVPEWLCVIIARLQAKKHENRFATAREVADLLGHCQEEIQRGGKVQIHLAKPEPSEGPASATARPRSTLRSRFALVTLLLGAMIPFAATMGVTHLRDGAFPSSSMTVPQLATATGSATEPAALPPTFKNGIGMEFVIVPKGKAWLGGGAGKPGDREVMVPADFYLGKYEVTQEEWEKLMGENPSEFSRTGTLRNAVKNVELADLRRFPVERVSWDDCQIFLERMNTREGETNWSYRLPTELEWEYACRGGPMQGLAEGAFDFYLSRPSNTLLPEQANFNEVLGRTCRVGSYGANRLGLCDMIGNVWEWCNDSELTEEGDIHRVSRGGCWTTKAWFCRAGMHFSALPSERNVVRGLRVARVRK